MSEKVMAGAEKMNAMYGLPEQVRFCGRCVMSNQRPSSSIEFKHTRDYRHRTLHIDEQGICDACKFAERKEQIDWGRREEELLRLLDRHRRAMGITTVLFRGAAVRTAAMRLMC